jgi:hypothetical protein
MNSKSVSVLCNMCKYIRIVNMRVCPPGWSTFYLPLNVIICVILLLSLYLCIIGYEKYRYISKISYIENIFD